MRLKNVQQLEMYRQPNQMMSAEFVLQIPDEIQTNVFVFSVAQRRLAAMHSMIWLIANESFN